MPTDQCVCVSIDGHVGGLHNLAIVSSAAVNMGLDISEILILILLDKFPEVALLSKWCSCYGK